MAKNIGQWFRGLFRHKEIEEPEVEKAVSEPESTLTVDEKINLVRQNEVMIEFLPMLTELVWAISKMAQGYTVVMDNGYAIRWLMEGYHSIVSYRGLVYEETIQVGHGNDVEKKRTVLLSRIDYEKEYDNGKIHQSFLPKPEVTFKLKTDDLVYLEGAWLALKSYQETTQAEKEAKEKEKALLKVEYKADIEKQIIELGIDKIVEEERERRGEIERK